MVCRHVGRPHRVLELTRPQTGPQDRPRGLQEGGILVGHVAAAVCDEFGGGVHQFRGAATRIDEAQVDDSFDELAIGSESPADAQVGLADSGNRVHQELCGDLAVGNLRRSWQCRIDEYDRGDRLRAGGRL